jgi:hypothetical protein
VVVKEAVHMELLLVVLADPVAAACITQVAEVQAPKATLVMV